MAGDELGERGLEGDLVLRQKDGDRGAVPRRQGSSLRDEAAVDTVHEARVRRADVPVSRGGAAAVDYRRECRGRIRAEGAAREQDEGGAALTRPHRLLLLARG